MRRHEVDRVRRRHLRRDDQVAFILAVFVIDEDIHAAIARFLDDLLDWHQSRRIVIGEEIAFQLAQRVCRRVPVGLVKIAQRVGMKPGGAGKAGAGEAAVIDEAAEFGDKLSAHDFFIFTL